ncbi:MAG: DUF3341 domain-containing protein [Paracoccaceae bacterium]
MAERGGDRDGATGGHAGHERADAGFKGIEQEGMARAEGPTPIHSFLARFDGPEALDRAVERAIEEGYVAIEACSPVPLPRIETRLGHDERRVSRIALVAAIAAGAAMYAFMYWTSVHAYVFHVGGRPYHAAPPFVMVTVATMLLTGVVAAFVAIVRLNDFPKPYHPMFNAPDFARASDDGFFLAIGANDPRFDAEKTWAFLESLEPAKVSEARE